MQYTEQQPPADWHHFNFNGKQWKTAAAAFGDSLSAQTQWQSRDLWVRRTFTIEDPGAEQLFLIARHDDDCEIFLNGEKIYTSGLQTAFNYVKLAGKLRKDDQW